MPKNMGKGGKSFKAGNAKGIMQNQKREIVLANPDENEEYAQVKKPLGNLRLELQLADGSKVIGVIRGAMVRKVWIGQGDVVLVSKREFNENDVVDVIHRYTPQEVRKLVKKEIIPRDFRSADERDANNAHSDYVFVAENDEDDDDDDDDDDAKVIDRHKVVLDDPLANFDDL
ncbi:eukaryotic translation initiation factor 1A, putative [Trypanosoma equiperdum]|uniref:Eukaryotic translation initiation factor 1A, putative n=4 Tax=Trypanozoon TaxID=39700 RepID=Q57YI9_TRYB2|nr:eukaryotic translation initiation factor 1A,putative [Trypanosoma brucei gambiense DAL972]XP_847418.1 eukaryotic translation initiation factor 1A, putative [Trypanosoma brucei brucei TREU927]AAX69318.1 eukaryotic translation initiation factor 1A, putative [Trypanosoma brucei]RHW73161.1 eukaryotic translation initiation factor 1A [Trypanosoma brucei equiperdum]SCU65529.1 eukaryotic translation initiation factor 1A, putative [Trypanosoma equiperdum]AAZ13352.1 eukaryotic translation initiation|eukprot:XP_011775926.1 eukaryotic translation initiation factor 1A,putative [Trypanosoma brucei gambiense DAL972]